MSARAYRNALRDVLAARGATSHPLLSGVAGSQEIESFEVVVEGRTLLVESETYVGLSITGDEALVAAIAADVERRLRPPTAGAIGARFGWSFRSRLSLAEMGVKLDEISESPWTHGDSEQHGDYLGGKLAHGAVARIYRTGPTFIVNLVYRALGGDAVTAKQRIAEARSLLVEKVLPAILAADVVEAEPLE